MSTAVGKKGRGQHVLRSLNRPLSLSRHGLMEACRNIPYRTKQTIQQVDSNIADLKKKGDLEVSEASDELECAANIVRNQFPIRRFLDTYFVPSFC